MDAEKIQRLIGENVATARREARVQQGALADRMGIAQPTLSKWETGIALPSLVALMRVADALDVPLLALLKGVDAQSDGYRAGYVEGWRNCAAKLADMAREARTSPPWPHGGVS